LGLLLLAATLAGFVAIEAVAALLLSFGVQF
jgi:hypothetical protein